MPEPSMKAIRDFPEGARLSATFGEVCALLHKAYGGLVHQDVITALALIYGRDSDSVALGIARGFP